MTQDPQMEKVMTPAGDNAGREGAKRQRARSIAIALALGALVVIFYAATIVRLGPNALNKDTFGTPQGSAPADAGSGDEACKKAGTC